MPRGPSLYRIVEDSDSHLVLGGQKLGLWILTLFLLANAFVLLYVGLFVVSRRQLFPVIAGTALGLFFAVCGVAALVWAIRYRSRIDFDGDDRVVRLATGRSRSPTEIAFADIAAVEIETHRSRSGLEHRVYLVDAGGTEWLIDRSADGDSMRGLADRIRTLTRVGDPKKPGAVETSPAAATAAAAAAWSRSGRPTPAGDAPPAGISVVTDGEATVYGWRTLPRSLFWVVFWAFLTLLLGGLAGLLLAGFVVEIARQPLAVTLIFLALAAATVGLMYVVSHRFRRRGGAWLGLAVLAVVLANLLIGSQPFILFGAGAAVVGYIASLCGFVLLARCRLRVSSAALEYEERILGIPLAWRRRSLAAAELEGFRIKAVVRGGGAVEVRGSGGRSFTLMIPQGAGAFSRQDLEWLRRQWLDHLGR